MKNLLINTVIALITLTGVYTAQSNDNDVLSFELEIDESGDMVLDDIDLHFEDDQFVIENPFGMHGPIWSRSALRAYALKQVTKGRISVSPLFGDTFEIEVTGQTAGEVLNKLSRVEVQIRTFRPTEEKLYFYVNLTDSSGYSLFYGDVAGVPLFQDEFGNWTFDRQLIDLKMSSYIYLPVPIEIEDDSAEAEITLRNENGYVISRDNYRIYDGKFYFPSRHAGHYGEVKFTTDYNLTYVYDIQTGQKMTRIAIDADSNLVGLEIKNYHEFTMNGGTYFDELVFSKDSEVGQSMEPPVYRVKVTETSTIRIYSYNYYVENDDQNQVFVIELPMMIVEDIASGDEFVINNDSIFDITLNPGEYMIRLVFDYLEEPEDPYYYGEKG